MSAENSPQIALQQRNQELTILNTIAQALNAAATLDEALAAALKHASEHFQLETGWIWLIREGEEPEDDDEPLATYLAASQNLPPVLEANPILMEGGCWCIGSYKSGDMLGAANVNIISCSRLRDLVDGTNGLSFHASVPLYARGKKLGIFNLASTDWRELSAENLRLLHTIGDLLAISIERAALFEKQRELGMMRERNRLARELHDTIAQGLAGIVLQLESAESLLETDRTPETPVNTALNLARQNLEEARRSVMDLRAAPLEGKTLPEALRELASHVTVNIVGENRPIAPAISAGIYRIAQEALSNVERHANATEVKLNLVLGVDSAELTITDNGQGFDTSQLPKDRFGLIGMNERASLLGGSLSIESDIGGGTTLNVTLPI